MVCVAGELASEWRSSGQARRKDSSEEMTPTGKVAPCHYSVKGRDVLMSWPSAP